MSHDGEFRVPWQVVGHVMHMMFVTCWSNEVTLVFMVVVVVLRIRFSSIRNGNYGYSFASR